jgi:hypothetical protein
LSGGPSCKGFCRLPDPRLKLSPGRFRLRLYDYGLSKDMVPT